MTEFTPVEQYGSIYVKRDDLYECNGMFGAKVRAAYELMKLAKKQGYTTVSTLGAKSSPQVNIAASVAQVLNMKVVGHTTIAPLEYDMLKAKEKGAQVLQHKCGYTNVIVKRARDWAMDNNAFYLPFGMDTETSVNLTREQVSSIIPYLDKVKRIVITAGSGINLSGLIIGLLDHNVHIPVLGVMVGHNPTKTLEKYLGSGWNEYVTLLQAEQDYNDPAEYTNINGLDVDSTYEGKCIPFIEPGDLFWVIGKKEKQTKGKQRIV